MTETNPIGSIGRRMYKRDDLKALKDGNTKYLTNNQIKQGVPAPTMTYKLVDSENHNKVLEWNDKSSGELLIKLQCLH